MFFVFRMLTTIKLFKILIIKGLDLKIFYLKNL